MPVSTHCLWEVFLLYQFIIRFVFILYNYQTLSASVLHSLVYYFQFILDYIDETPNLTEDVEYNEKKKDQLIHSLRPSLFNVDLFEVLNRILHEPVVHSSSSHLSDHDKEIVALSKIAKQIVTVVFLSYIIVWSIFLYCNWTSSCFCWSFIYNETCYIKFDIPRLSYVWYISNYCSNVS